MEKESKVKTNDGHELHINHIYHNSMGEIVSLVEVLTNQDGKSRFLVVPIFEGETMDVKLYPGGHTEVTASYTHEAMPVIIDAIYKDEPIPLLGDKFASEVNRITSIAETTGELIRREKELSIKLSKMLRNEEEKSKQIDELDKKIETKTELLASKTAEFAEIKQKINELEDSVGEAGATADTINIQVVELLRLRKMAHLVTCLEAEGVDNWNGYEYAIERYRERYPGE